MSYRRYRELPDSTEKKQFQSKGYQFNVCKNIEMESVSLQQLGAFAQLRLQRGETEVQIARGELPFRVYNPICVFIAKA